MERHNRLSSICHRLVQSTLLYSSSAASHPPRRVADLNILDDINMTSTSSDNPLPQSNSADFEAPYPGSKEMPKWETGELIDAPRFGMKNWAMMLGPGLILGGAAIGGGEWLTGPWLASLIRRHLIVAGDFSILGQVIYNIEISRYTLYTGEPIFTGKFRIPPDPSSG
ncbi:MAG: hypothetical protein R3C11_16405 [Planctomycetaceae bacterium]